MDNLFDKKRRIEIHVPGWVGFMLDVLVWQIRKQKAANGERLPGPAEVVEHLLMQYFADKKPEILELLNDEAERELLNDPTHAGLAATGLLRFAGRIRVYLSRACPDSGRDLRTYLRPKRAPHACGPALAESSEDGGGVTPPGAPGWEH